MLGSIACGVAAVFGVVACALLLVVLLVSLRCGHRTPASSPPSLSSSIVLLSRWQGVGIHGASGLPNDVYFMQELVRQRAVYLPQHSSLVVAPRAACTAQLVTIARDHLRQGARVLVGVLMSDDMAALAPLAAQYPDALFISTASTAPSLALPDNMFRLPCPDNRAVKYFAPLLSSTFPHVSTWVVHADPTNSWATQLQQQLKLPVLQSVARWSDVDASVVASAAAKVGFFSITERNADSMKELRAQPWFTAALLPSAPVVFADTAAFDPSWAAQPTFHGAHTPVYAVTSLGMAASATMARNVLGTMVSPFVANLLLAGRVGVQALVLRQAGDKRVVATVAAARSADTGTGMFDVNGDRVDVEVGVVQWQPVTNTWRVVATAGDHHSLGSFTAQYPSQRKTLGAT